MEDMTQPPAQGLQAPVSGAPGQNLITVPLTPEQIADWWKEIDKAKERRAKLEAEWDTLLDAYKPVVSSATTPEDVKANVHFRNIHTKIGQLFVRSPKVRCIPKGPANSQVMTQYPDPVNPAAPPIEVPMQLDRIVAIRQEVINSFMGRGKINGTRLMDECLFDMLAWAGICAVKVGYKATTKMVQQPVMVPDPSFVPPQRTGSILDLAPAPQPPMVQDIDPLTMEPKFEQVPVVIHEEWYAKRFSPKKLLFNSDLTTARHNEEAWWIGHEGFMPIKQAVREFGVNEADLTKSDEDDRVHKHDDMNPSSATGKNLVHYYEIYYKGVRTIDDEFHPEAIYQLILLDGMKEKAAVSRRSPDQTFDEMGKLTPDSLKGFPIKIGCLRDYSDSPYPKSDSAFTNTSAKEINTYRKQGVKLRDAAIGKYFFDQGAFDTTDIDTLKNGEVGEYVGVKPGLLAQGPDKIFFPTSQVKASPDDYRMAQILKQDMDETLGISSVQAGTPLETTRSATEVADFGAGAQGRQEKERDRAIQFYLDVVEAVDALVIRYADEGDYVAILGPDGTQQFIQWNKFIIDGPMSFDIEPDSAYYTDAARMRQQDLQFYNLVAQDPLVDRSYVLRRLATRFSFDPNKIILNPMMQGMQPPGGGPVNKHQTENSGGRPNAKGADAAGNRQERTMAPPGGPK